MNFNKVELAGNVTRDLEIKYTPKGTAVAEVGIAVNKRIPARDGEDPREEVMFVDVTFFGKTAEVLGLHATKGTGLFIEGELKIDRWEDKEQQKMRTKLKVIGQHFQFTGSPRNGGGKHDPAPAPGAPVPARPETRPARPDGPLDEEDEIPL